jgi:polygalacturonase
VKSAQKSLYEINMTTGNKARILNYFLLMVMLVLISFSDTQNYFVKDKPALKWSKDVGAKSFPWLFKVCWANDYGAVSDGKTLCTKAIQSAIDDCAANGGGRVKFQPGRYLTGSVFIKENVNLVIDKDVTILGSQSIDDYPDIETRVAGIEMIWPAALINFIGQSKAAITGRGTIHAQGKPFWEKYWKMRREEYEPKGLRWIVDYDCKRPRTILVSRCSDITIKNITLMQAGFWTVHILYSENVTVDGIVIRNNVDGSGPSTDGIDIDSSTKILVQNCDIDCNDDNFCLKAGRDADGLRINRPTEYVVIRNCISRHGAGLVTCGSETSGGIRYILAKNLKASGTGTGIRLKSAKTRGGTVEYIYAGNIKMNGVRVVFQADLNWNPAYSYSSLPEGYNYNDLPAHWKVMLEKVEPEEKGIPHFRNIYIYNIKADGAGTAIDAVGLEESKFENFNFSNVEISARNAGRIDYGRDWNMRNVNIVTEVGDAVVEQNCVNMNWNR